MPSLLAVWFDVLLKAYYQFSNERIAPNLKQIMDNLPVILSLPKMELTVFWIISWRIAPAAYQTLEAEQQVRCCRSVRAKPHRHCPSPFSRAAHF
jgi:hypothetical protein